EPGTRSRMGGSAANWSRRPAASPPAQSAEQGRRGRAACSDVRAPEALAVRHLVLGVLQNMTVADGLFIRAREGSVQPQAAVIGWLLPRESGSWHRSAFRRLGQPHGPVAIRAAGGALET